MLLVPNNSLGILLVQTQRPPLEVEVRFLHQGMCQQFSTQKVGATGFRTTSASPAPLELSLHIPVPREGLASSASGSLEKLQLLSAFSSCDGTQTFLSGDASVSELTRSL